LFTLQQNNTSSFRSPNFLLMENAHRRRYEEEEDDDDEEEEDPAALPAGEEARGLWTGLRA
jgi:hypothetical protein